MHNDFRLETEVNHQHFEHERRVKLMADEALVARTGNAKTWWPPEILALARANLLVRLTQMLVPSPRLLPGVPRARS
jgi:hypothetical protein